MFSFGLSGESAVTTGIRRSSLGPFEAIVLESDALRAVVLPELGGRVWELEDRICGRQWIWNRGIDHLHAQPVGANYDEIWAGGWEELFPNDAPGSFEGRDLPDHGEWWATAWQVAGMSAGTEQCLRLASTLSVVRSSCFKEFRLAGATLEVRYSIRSEEPVPFHFLFKQHLPIRLTPQCRLSLPGGTARAVDPAFGSKVKTNREFNWPMAVSEGKSADLREVPPAASRQQEFLYVRDLPQPWCGVDDPGRGASIRMRFEATDLPYVWLFLTFGSWRGYYTAVLEPCTNMPKDLAQATRLGQSALLRPGEEFRTRVTVAVSPLATEAAEPSESKGRPT